jgi:hypothetical protein
VAGQAARRRPPPDRHPHPRLRKPPGRESSLDFFSKHTDR